MFALADPHPRCAMYVAAYVLIAPEVSVPRGRIRYESRLRELAARDKEGLHWKLTPQKQFLSSYAAWFVDVPFSEGFFYSFLQEAEPFFRLERSDPVFLMDMFEQRHRGTQPISIVPRDPLGVNGVPDGTDWRGMTDSYFKSIPEERRVELYLRHLRGGRRSHMMDDIYDDELLHFRAYEERLAEMLSIIKSTTEEVIHIPGDGIGVGAIAGRMLGRQVISSEPHGIGELARRLSIINNPWTVEQHVAAYPQGTYVFSNLSRFVDMPSLSQKVRAIIYDVNIVLYPYYSKVNTQGTILQNHPIMSGPALVPYQSVRPIDEMLILPMKPVDEKTRIQLENNSKLDESSEITASITVSEAESNSFILSQRKFLQDPPRRPGEVQVLDGFVNSYEEGVHKVYNKRGFETRADRPYHLMTVLSEKYDLKGRKEMYIEVKFDPSRLKFAYDLGRLRAIEPLYVNKRFDSYYEVTIRSKIRGVMETLVIDRGVTIQRDDIDYQKQQTDKAARTQEAWQYTRKDQYEWGDN